MSSTTAKTMTTSGRTPGRKKYIYFFKNIKCHTISASPARSDLNAGDANDDDDENDNDNINDHHKEEDDDDQIIFSKGIECYTFSEAQARSDSNDDDANDDNDATTTISVVSLPVKVYKFLQVSKDIICDPSCPYICCCTSQFLSYGPQSFFVHCCLMSAVFIT